ncbi:hypothetical protein [Actinomadura sp. 21ATH]|uniref:hypothetical protein n=1 Tax=Actinomadura sp. 21ATH TaxID=1735444 RepID=UPI0035BF38E8
MSLIGPPNLHSRYPQKHGVAVIGWGLEPGLTSAELADPVAARRRIVQLETELAVTRRAVELVREAVPPTTLPSHRGDGRAKARPSRPAAAS